MSSVRSAPPAVLGYLPTLDGWRAVAIALVLIAHASEHPLWVAEGPDGGWYRLTRYGAFGVTLFFAISGFLITHRLLDERESVGRIDLGAFYWRRAFRILPPYLAYLIVVSLLSVTGLITLAPGEVASCLYFGRNYWALFHPGSWYTAHFWSLAVEEHFYILWPAALLLLSRSQRGLTFAAAAAVTIALWRWANFRLGPLAHLFPDAGLGIRTDILLDGLLAGAAAAFALRLGWWRRLFERCLKGPRLFAPAALIIVCLPATVLPLSALWISLAAPLLLLGTALNPSASVSRVLEAKPVRWIGRLSYSLYVWQQLFLVAHFEARPLSFGPWQEFPLNIALAALCAVVSFYLVEQPALRIGRRWLAKRGLRQANAAAI